MTRRARLSWFGRCLACTLMIGASRGAPSENVELLGVAELFAPGVASTNHSEVRLTVSPDGRTAMWFSRDRPGGPGGYDIWVSRRSAAGWSPARPASFNSAGRDFDPAFSADGRTLFFCSDRQGGSGGDDLYRVAVTREGFGAPINLGPKVNSPADEFAPMLSPNGRKLLFSSDRPGGSGGHDLFTAALEGGGYARPERLAGKINGLAHEFDATFLSDNHTIIFARTMDFATDPVHLFQASSIHGVYDAGEPLGSNVNNDRNSYGAMLDWSSPDRISFSGSRRRDGAMDLYRIRFRLRTLSR
ncbi:TolB family protein [Allosphingosinicella deserti]|uniref:Uncharacterized protein n=1 Tax=Allosphingosinicella deserti TaxID=2116704 RepID=A0A2P7QH59_9SPHN|nr:PD40 domain-containing protein [Sphingomonas deserti]PSJ37314.1 hypothetical protein C7I55_22620 [Sphingomonas deserti]